MEVLRVWYRWKGLIKEDLDIGIPRRGVYFPWSYSVFTGLLLHECHFNTVEWVWKFQIRGFGVDMVSQSHVMIYFVYIPRGIVIL